MLDVLGSPNWIPDLKDLADENHLSSINHV
jgi:hypothetical protein